MKTIQRSLLLTLCLVVCAQFSLQAIPAWPGVFKYTQPDGTVVSLQRHGDEFFSWTTFAGTDQVCALDADGFYRLSYLDKASMAQASIRRQSVNQGRIHPRGSQNDDVLTHGARHIPVLLANFADVNFQISNPKAQFDALLNESGYSANGGTGSVRDYYSDNSNGEFTPIFDVYGPVTLSQEMAYYGGNSGSNHSIRAYVAVAEAAMLLDDQIDFSQYDYDNDGYVDMVLFYYAGYNEAEGGPEDSIWPHQSNLNGSISFDGTMMGTYFCTSELRLNEGVNMCGIGTTCHEFAHSLGLPDFYDTDYAQNGMCGGLYWFSTMCSGCYNNDGRTPPYLNAEERVLLGWMADSDIQTLEKGTVSFGSIKDDIAYRSYTDTEGEYFLYECRDGSGWDSPINKLSGLIVYHVDKSNVRSVGGLTPYEQWANWNRYNTINAYADHPCFYVVISSDQENLYYNDPKSEWSADRITFPGAANITTYSPVDWDGNDTKDIISGISYADGIVTLAFDSTDQQKVLGTVCGQDGVPVQGVYVVVTKPDAAGSPKLQKVSPRTKSFDAVTDSKGAFTIILDGFEGETAHLSFSKDGYHPSGIDVTLSPRATQVQAVIKKKGEGDLMEYSYYDPSASLRVFGPGSDYTPDQSYMAAIRIPASDLPANGGRLTKVSFPTLWTAKAYYVVVDSGEERLLFHEIPELGPTAQMQRTVDINLGSLDVNFSADKDLYVGIAIEGANPYSDYDGYYFFITYGDANCYSSPFNKTSSNWHSNNKYVLVLSASVIPNEYTLADMGFNAIADPGLGNYTSGQAFALDVNLAQGNQLQSGINWTMDGTAIATGVKSVSLTSGKHTITASYTLTDGTSETLELLVNVQ